MRWTSGLIAAAAVLPLLTLACAGPRLEAPPGYAALKSAPLFDFKAISAQGHVIAVRRHANPSTDADLDYWSQAVEHQKVDVEGMKLVAREAVRTDRGQDGTLFQFELGEGQRRTAYWVAVFAKGFTITTVEVAGSSEGVALEADALKTSIRSLR